MGTGGRGRRAAVLAVTGSVLMACTLLTDLEGFSTQSVQPDAAGPDASGVFDAPQEVEASVDAGCRGVSCLDFDTDPFDEGWLRELQGVYDLRATDAGYVSPPRSLLSGIQGRNDAGQTTHPIARLRRLIPKGARRTRLSFQVRLVPPFGPQNGGYLSVGEFACSGDGGFTGAWFVQNKDGWYLAGGADLPAPAIPPNIWTQVVLDVTWSPGPPSAKLTVSGQEVTVPLDQSCADANDHYAAVGLAMRTAPFGVEALYDDVVLEIERP